MNIIGYIHICQKDGWQRSFKMLMDCIISSGLYENTVTIRLGILNDERILIDDDILNDKKFDIIYTGKSSEYERPTLLHMRKMSGQDRGGTVYYYLHTKGLRHFGKDTELNVIDWINLMLYWNIERWELALENLKTFDTYGCNDTGHHYSGNFWWAKKEHILKLPEFIEEYYTAPEDWVQKVGTNKCSIFMSGIQGCGHYNHRFPRELYVKDEILSEKKKVKTICLNMIVKNESKIITRLLDSVYSIIDYYVICDTGSTDDTIDKITTFFNSKCINGFIFKEDFVDFSYNRNISLQKCKDLTDYVLLLDADMVLEINKSFDKKDLICEYYTLSQGNENFYYHNMTRIVKNNGMYSYFGLTHEYINTPVGAVGGNIKKDILFIRDIGDGGSKTNKFERDKILLLKGIIEEPNNERYHYYLANTYRDLGDVQNAIVYYKKRIEMGGWFDEKYICCLNLYKLITDNSRYFYLIESFHINPKRVEGIFELIKYYTVKKDYQLCYHFYTFIKDYYENEYYNSDGDISHKLFATIIDYTFYLPYYMIIVCWYSKKHEEGILMYNLIFKRKSFQSQWWMDNLLFNLQFYKEYFTPDFINNLKEYLSFLKAKNVDITKLGTIID